MKFFLFHSFQKKPKDNKNQLMLVAINEPPSNTNEGSEFLDDALRMTEQPLWYTEESLAPESSRGLIEAIYRIF